VDIGDKLADAGFDDVVYFPDFGEECVIGVSSDDRVIYSFDKMVEYLVNDGMSDIDAIDYLEYNTLRSIPYLDNRIDGKGKAPIVMYSRDWLGI
jgi:hypothetical protein